jgi:hypothetical protein
MLADKIAGFRSEVGTIPSNVDLHKLPFYLWSFLVVEKNAEDCFDFPNAVLN